MPKKNGLKHTYKGLKQEFFKNMMNEGMSLKHTYKGLKPIVTVKFLSIFSEFEAYL